MAKVYRKIFTDETEEELMSMTREEASLELSDKQRRFCELFVKNLNVRVAAAKAGYSTKTSHIMGYKMRQDPNINRYIAWLKLRVGKECHVSAVDIIDQYVRIAFADITDFVEIKGGKLTIIDDSQLDGQLITKIRSGKGGITVELADKLKALEKLEHYFDVMPIDWKQKIEERKIQLLEQRLEIERIKAGQGDDEIVDDGFIEALKGSAEQIWADELPK